MKRENPEFYMQNLKKWLAETANQELGELWKKNPSLTVTGVDLCQDMHDQLLRKHIK